MPDETNDVDVVEAAPDYQANVGPSSDPDAPCVDPNTPDVEYTRENDEPVAAPKPFEQKADEWFAARQADLEAQKNTGEWVEDFPNWNIWQTDDRRGTWHAAHKNNVDYFQVSKEDDLKGLLAEYGKDR